MKQITIKFIENYPPYQKGETATFFEVQATRLVDRSFAVYASGDPARETAADKLRALRGAPADRMVHGPAQTRVIKGPEAVKSPMRGEDGQGEGNTGTGPKGPSPVEGATKDAKPITLSTRKCGKCGLPGHIKTNCPNK